MLFCPPIIRYIEGRNSVKEIFQLPGLTIHSSVYERKDRWLPYDRECFVEMAPMLRKGLAYERRPGY